MLRPKNIKNPEQKFSFRTEVRKEDIETIKNLCSSTGFFSVDEVAVAGQLAEEYFSLGKKSGYNFIFCEYGGNPIGYSCFGRIPVTESSFDLYWIVVEKAWQGKGIGKKLLELSEEEAMKQGCVRIYAETSGRSQYQSTVSFYENQGYYNEATIADFYRVGDSKHILVKALQ